MKDCALRSKVVAILTISALFAQLAPLPGMLGRAHAQQAAPSGAEDKDARQLFEAGRAAYDEGRYKEALVHFQAAHALSGRPALLYNVGQAADRLRKDALALDAFEGYLEALPEAVNRVAVEERIQVLRAVLAEREAATAPVATPAEVAAAAEPAPVLTEAPIMQPEAAPSDQDDDSLLSKWWLWAAAGGVVAGVVVVVLVASSGGAAQQGEQTTGSDGNVIVALSY